MNLRTNLSLSPASGNRILLALILLIAGFLRFYKLGFQSFWLDELHTVIETDPALKWKDLLFYLKCCDPHPPLFFAVEKIFFLLFGSTEFIARSVSALAGTISVWIVYLLGKELYSSRLGLVAATFTCFNYFHIWYSQEARPYAFAFLFAVLSFLYLIRLIKNPRWKTGILYSIYTLLMLGSHYFGLFVFVSQICIALLFWREAENKLLYFRHFLFAGLIIGAGFSPWLPFLLSTAGIKSFWIEPIKPSFAIDFFYEYFGKSDLLKPFLILFLISGLVHLFIKSKIGSKSIKEDVYSFGFIICFLWIGISLIIPYIRSILVVPMLFPRYTIVLLPAFILILAFGIELIANIFIKYSLLIFFCLLSLTDLFFIQKHYSQIHKTPFRELGQYIASDTLFVFPVISEVTAWHQQYYLRKYGYSLNVMEGPKEVMLDSVMKNPELQGFWLSDAHGGQKPKDELLEKIQKSFIKVKEKDFHDAWAQLYITRDVNKSGWIELNHRSFSPDHLFELNGDSVTAIWEGRVISRPLNLLKGSYMVNVQLSGTPAGGVFPHLNVYVGDKFIGSFYASGSYEYHTLSFYAEEDSETSVRIEMDNDAVNAAAKEDRNAFVKSILLLKIKDK